MQNIESKVVNEVFFVRREICKYKKISSEIKKQLLEIFKQEPYPDKILFKDLSEKFYLKKNQLQNWFKYHF